MLRGGVVMVVALLLLFSVQLTLAQDQAVSVDLPLLKKAKKHEKPEVFKTLVNLVDGSGLNFFMRAVVNNDKSAIREFVNLGLVNDLSDVDRDLKVALIVFLFRQDASIAQFLIEKGAKVTQEALDAATRRKNIEMMRVVFGNNVEKTYALTESCIKNAPTRYVLLLLEHGVHINTRLPDGNPIVSGIFIHRKSELLDSILVWRPDFSIPNDKGEIPLLVVTSLGSNDDVQKVLKLTPASEIDHPDYSDVTALNRAGAVGSKEKMESLYRGGARFESASNIVTVALRSGSDEAASFALEHGNISLTLDSDGNTDLMAAAESASPALFDKVLEVFSKTPAAINLQNEQGWSALMYSARRTDKSFFDKLIKAGAAFTLRSKDGQDAFSIAESANNKEVAEFLSPHFIQGHGSCEGVKTTNGEPDWRQVELTDTAGKSTVEKVFCDPKYDGGGWMLASEFSNGNLTYSGYQKTLSQIIASKISNLEFRVEVKANGGKVYKQFLKNTGSMKNRNGNNYFGSCKRKWSDAYEGSDWGLGPDLTRPLIVTDEDAKNSSKGYWELSVNDSCHNTITSNDGSQYIANGPTYCSSHNAWCGGLKITPQKVWSIGCGSDHGFSSTPQGASVVKRDYEAEIGDVTSIRIWIK